MRRGEAYPRWTWRSWVWLLPAGLIAGFSPQPSEAQPFTLTQITSTNGGIVSASGPSINADGTRIAFQSDRDLTGGNADGNFEIFRWTQGSGFTQITSTTGGAFFDVSINADGTRIAFQSDRDLTGGNADGNSEIFLASSPETIATLSEWAQLIMVALLVGGGLLALRRRSAH